ncbi:AGAP005221-PA [Anopheles gambiae str. PEST]|uniref:AGAP005221-PA n=1 Tax=Anopheles gambiae TaxID=7165 RepID=Q7PHH2_ANOGA|nr:AGAP005221-PA [Anopheles gambiae str. PEST]
MGRKINLERPKKGPGRKARKQPEPEFQFKKGEDEDSNKKLSRHQIQRLKKREMLKQKQKEEKKTKKATKNAAKVAAVPNTFDPAEIFNIEKSRQKYQQLGQKSKTPQPVATNGHQNGSAKKGRNLFDSDNEMDEDEQKAATGKKVQVKKSQMKKFLQRAESEDESDSEEEEMDSDVEEEEDEEAESVEGEEDDYEDEDVGEELDDEEENDEMGAEEDYEDDDEDDEDDEDEEDEDDDDEDDEDGDMLPIEAANKKLKKRMEREQKEADAEMAEAAVNRERFAFPTEEELAQTTSLQDVNMRIKDVVGVLSDFAANRDPNRSRCEYIDLLRRDLCLYYSYNDFFMGLLMEIFSPNELLEFLEASEIQRPVTIRTNSLKTRRRDLAQALINRGINLDPIGKWSKEGLVVYTSQVPLGATPEYLAGHYMLQGGSSMLPVMALAPEENERILDMCAAPGGKSSHIAALMKNTGVLFVNDANKERLHAVLGNFHRLGIQNAVITCMDGVKYGNIMKGFDRVLLDAPCTGSGVISKDPSVKATKNEIDVQRCFNLQRRLLLTAIDCLSASSPTGGYLVYSTCSILPQENEWVIDFALKRRNVRLVPTGLDFGVEGMTNFGAHRFHPTMKLTRRFYPHTHNLDGFFVAKLQKFSDAIPKSVDGEPEAEDEVEEEPEEEMKLPKKIDKRDWYYQDIIDERKAQREDKNKNHVVTVFQKPANVKKGPKKPKQPQPSAGEREQKPQKPASEEPKQPATNGTSSSSKQRQPAPKSNTEQREAEEALRLKKKLKQVQTKNGKAGPGGKKNGEKKKVVQGVKKGAFKSKVGKMRTAK